MLHFKMWIVRRYATQENPIGDLARDIAEDYSFPRSKGREYMRSYLKSRGACPGCMTAFAEAWDIYEKEKKEEGLRV
jgi:uncharacterized protein YozE (UPF0346 family)